MHGCIASCRVIFRLRHRESCEESRYFRELLHLNLDMLNGREQLFVYLAPDFLSALLGLSGVHISSHSINLCQMQFCALATRRKTCHLCLQCMSSVL